MKTLLAGALALACVLMLGTPPSDAAPDVVSQIKTQLKTAIFHSGELAQKAGALGAVQLHAHHALNCVEGPKGADFLPQAGYPCKGQGNGIIPDLQTAVTQLVPGAQAALQEAMIAETLLEHALASKNINEA